MVKYRCLFCFYPVREVQPGFKMLDLSGELTFHPTISLTVSETTPSFIFLSFLFCKKLSVIHDLTILSSKNHCKVGYTKRKWLVQVQHSLTTTSCQVSVSMLIIKICSYCVYCQRNLHLNSENFRLVKSIFCIISMNQETPESRQNTNQTITKWRKGFEWLLARSNCEHTYVGGGWKKLKI